MTELDLHGVRHHEVEPLVEEFLLRTIPPVLIITGDSPAMKQMVWQVVEKLGYGWMYESEWNLGAIVVLDRLI